MCVCVCVLVVVVVVVWWGVFDICHKKVVFFLRLPLKKIYIQQIRSKLEQSAVVWHSSLTQKCKDKLERVQKSAFRIILECNESSEFTIIGGEEGVPVSKICKKVSAS